MNCALGLAQLRRIDELIALRSRLMSMYRERLGNEKRIQWQHVSPDSEVNWFVLVIRLNDDYGREDRDRILTELAARGIECSNYFSPIHLQPFYAERSDRPSETFPVCEALSQRTIALPFHHELTEADVDVVCNHLQSLL